MVFISLAITCLVVIGVNAIVFNVAQGAGEDIPVYQNIEHADTVYYMNPEEISSLTWDEGTEGIEAEEEILGGLKFMGQRIFPDGVYLGSKEAIEIDDGVDTTHGIMYLCQDEGCGIRADASGKIQSLSSGGSWTALGCTGSESGFWVADAANAFVYTTNNTGGGHYPVIIGGSATSTTIDTNTVLDVIGQSVMGATHFTGAVQGTSTLEITGAATLHSTLAVTGNSTLVGTLGVTGVTTMVGASSTRLTVSGQTVLAGANTFATTTVTDGDFVVDGTTFVVDNDNNKVGIGSSTPLYALSIVNTGTQLALAYDQNNQSSLTVGSTGDLTFAVDGGDVAWGSANRTGSGNVSGANATFTGSATFDTDTLYVNNSTNRVMMGTTTDLGHVLTVEDNTVWIDSTSPNDFLFKVYKSGDDGATAWYADAATTSVVHSNDDIYFDKETLYIDISQPGVALGSTTPKALLQVGSTTPNYLTGYRDAVFSGGIEVDKTSYFDGSFYITDTGSHVAIASNTADKVLFQVGSSTPSHVSGYRDAFVAGGLEVDGTSYFDGALTLASTLSVTGVTTLVNASTTVFTADNAYLHTASTTAFTASTIGASGAVTLASTLGVTGVTTLVNASTTNLTVSTNSYLDGDTIIGTDSLFVDVSKDATGIGTTTLTSGAILTIATGSPSQATSSIDFGKPCWKVVGNDGSTATYLFLNVVGSSIDWATSTTSCF